MLDAGRIRLVSEKLQAFYVRGNTEEICHFFSPERATYNGVYLFSLNAWFCLKAFM